MSDRIFRLLERLQKLEDALRRAQRAAATDPFEIARLRYRKSAVKRRLAHVTLRRAAFA